MDVAQLTSITDAQRLREIVIGQMAMNAERDVQLTERDTQVAERDARIAQGDARVAQQRDLLDRRDQTIVYTEAKMAKLTAEILRLRRVQFAARSEKMDPEQRALVDEATAADLAALEVELAEAQHSDGVTKAAAPRRLPSKRRPLLPELPRIERANQTPTLRALRGPTATPRLGTRSARLEERVKDVDLVRIRCKIVFSKRRLLQACRACEVASKMRCFSIISLLASLVLLTACRTPPEVKVARPDPCVVDQSLYAAAYARDNLVVVDSSPVMRFAFPDPAIAEPMHQEPIADLEDLRAANASVFTLQAGFERAYACLQVIGVTPIPADGAQRPQIRVDYIYQGQQRQAYAYGTRPATCVRDSSAALIIPGSGLNQSSAIVARDSSNYHAGVLDALDTIKWHYVLIKPNEDVLAWHDGSLRKVGGDLIWNWHLNRNGSYSVAYLVQGMAVKKWLDSCFSKRVLAGLSQGGAAAMLIGLQSKPSDVIVASGHSLLFNQAEWAGHNQLIGIPSWVELSRTATLVGALERSSSRWLFTYGKMESDIYKIEAETGLTARHIENLPNVEVSVHAGAHSFPLQEIQAFLARGSSNPKQRRPDTAL